MPTCDFCLRLFNVLYFRYQLNFCNQLNLFLHHLIQTLFSSPYTFFFSLPIISNVFYFVKFQVSQNRDMLSFYENPNVSKLAFLKRFLRPILHFLKIFATQKSPKTPYAIMVYRTFYMVFNWGLGTSTIKTVYPVGYAVFIFVYGG